MGETRMASSFARAIPIKNCGRCEDVNAVAPRLPVMFLAVSTCFPYGDFANVGIACLLLFLWDNYTLIQVLDSHCQRRVALNGARPAGWCKEKALSILDAALPFVFGVRAFDHE